MSVAALLRLATIDLRPLRHRDFRLLFGGQLVSFLGSQLTFVAVPFQVYQLTRSSLAVGLLGLVELGPVLAFAFLGGALADARDRDLPMRMAAYCQAVSRVAAATRDRGLYP